MAAKKATGGVAEGAGSDLFRSERRRAPRVLVNLDVDWANADNFLFASITDISATGVFVRTTEPEPPGTRINLRFTPTGDEEDVLEVEGEVIWVNAYRPGHSLNPGMGIRFVALADDDRRRLAYFVKTFAHLDEEVTGEFDPITDDDED